MLKLSFPLEIELLGVSSSIAAQAQRYNTLIVRKSFVIRYDFNESFRLYKSPATIIEDILKLFLSFFITLRKHSYSNTLKILPPKNDNFSDKKNSDIFHISAQNIDCGYSLEPPRRGGTNEYPQSMFLSRNKKNNVYPCKPQFYYIKVGFKGVKII